ncbi:right-handed parallel beta-helix repeat-containing protein [Streptomyces sp. NPDC005426]|uniref:right-handed parallel beta-helix repeat-containing protein n=1 Tax=Streptomyces sp. NPDC005426 TaxID=3155344 RepID=UPI0033A8E771
MSWTRRLLVLLAALAAALLAAPAAQAHEERPVTLPDGTGSVPVYRTGEPDLLVCKSDRADFERRISGFPDALRTRNLALFERCRKSGYRHLQQAVDAVTGPGMNIAILPGLYEEEPSLPAPEGECSRLKAPNSQLGYQILSYAQQARCPHNQNLVAILGKKDLQIEGTGATRTDVVIDAKYQKLNAVRADGSDGVYFKNFTAQRTTFNSLYILAQDGFVIDDVLTRWNDEYGFLTFASDHGLYKNCESYGNGDSGIYPGSASDINDAHGYEVPRYSIEITGCRSHHNMVGYSGTAGDSVYVHDNEFDHNMGGASMDSAFPGHPGLPQNHARFERNLIHDNNADYYPYVADGTCAKPPVERGYEDGVVCPQISMPPGSGIITAGGNWNLYENNWVYGQKRAAFFLSAVPAFIRGEDALGKQTDTSHHNRYANNHLGTDKQGRSRPNGTDVWWDGQGAGNCWQPDTGASTPRSLPACGSERGAVTGSTDRLVGEPVKLAQLLVCADYDVRARRLPAGCDWYGARGIARIEVQAALGIAVVLALVGGVLWWRRLRSSRPATVATVLGLIGLGLDVAGSTMGLAATYVPALALLLTGLWWTGIGLVLRRERPGLGWTTVALGGLTLLDALDKGVFMIPWIPLSPAWVRGLLGLVWVVWAVVAAARHGERATGAPGAAADAGGSEGPPSGPGTDPVPVAVPASASASASAPDSASAPAPDSAPGSARTPNPDGPSSAEASAPPARPAPGAPPASGPPAPPAGAPASGPDGEPS